MPSLLGRPRASPARRTWTSTPTWPATPGSRSASSSTTGFATDRNRPAGPPPVGQRIRPGAPGRPRARRRRPTMTDAEFIRLAVAPNGANALASGFIQNNNTNKPPLFGASLTPGAASPFALEPAPSDGAIASGQRHRERRHRLHRLLLPARARPPTTSSARDCARAPAPSAAPIPVSNPALGNVDGASPRSPPPTPRRPASWPTSRARRLQRASSPPRSTSRRPAAGGGGDKVAPAISRFSLSRTTFRKGSKLPKLSAQSQDRHHDPLPAVRGRHGPAHLREGGEGAQGRQALPQAQPQEPQAQALHPLREGEDHAVGEGQGGRQQALVPGPPHPQAQPEDRALPLLDARHRRREERLEGDGQEALPPAGGGEERRRSVDSGARDHLRDRRGARRAGHAPRRGRPTAKIQAEPSPRRRPSRRPPRSRPHRRPRSPRAAPAPEPEEQAAPRSRAQAVARRPRAGSVQMRDFSFSPATITVNVGESVTWVNAGEEPHNAVGDNFSTSLLDAGKSGSKSFSTRGHVRLYLHGASADEGHRQGRGRCAQRGARDARPVHEEDTALRRTRTSRRAAARHQRARRLAAGPGRRGAARGRHGASAAARHEAHVALAAGSSRCAGAAAARGEAALREDREGRHRRRRRRQPLLPKRR